jgi:hypothetical protein
MQKRMERLQMGGLAQTNDSIAVVSINNSRPGTPKTKLAEGYSGQGNPAAPVPVPPAYQPGPGSRSYRMRAAAAASSGLGGVSEAPAGPWQGSGPARSVPGLCLSTGLVHGTCNKTVSQEHASLATVSCYELQGCCMPLS